MQDLHKDMLVGIDHFFCWSGSLLIRSSIPFKLSYILSKPLTKRLIFVVFNANVIFSRRDTLQVHSGNIKLRNINLIDYWLKCEVEGIFFNFLSFHFYLLQHSMKNELVVVATRNVLPTMRTSAITCACPRQKDRTCRQCCWNVLLLRKPDLCAETDPWTLQSKNNMGFP